MSGKTKGFVDVTSQDDQGGYVDVTKAPPPMTKEEEARVESSRARDAEEAAPPTYTTTADGSGGGVASRSELQPPSLSTEVDAGIRYLAEGDPNETVSVPMIHSSEKKNLKQAFLGLKGKVTQVVIVRKMPRSYYLQHYAKDVDGNYVGTEKPAADAGLVFVPSKSTPEDILEQVRKVAFGKMHYVDGRMAIPAGGLTF